MPHVGNGPAFVHTTSTRVLAEAEAPRADPPDVEWDHLFANWATDRGLGANDAAFRMLGTPGEVVARERFKAGASEKVVRGLLDAAMPVGSASGNVKH